MTSRNGVVYALLTVGALITLAPFGLGLLTSVTPPGSSPAAPRCPGRTRRPWTTSATWAVPDSVEPRRSRR